MSIKVILDCDDSVDGLVLTSYRNKCNVADEFKTSFDKG